MAGKWYTKEGVLVEEIPKKSGDGMTSRITKNRAKEMELIRSVTSKISDVLGDPFGLVGWKMSNAILATHENGIKPDEDWDEYTKRIKHISAEVGEEMADRGSALHGMMNRFIDNGEMAHDPAGTPLCEKLGEFIEFTEAVGATSEKMIITEDNIGTPDLFFHEINLHRVCEWCKEDIPEGLKEYGSLVLDFKTKDNMREGKAFPVYADVHLQLGAYYNMLDLKNALFLVWQADRENGISVPTLIFDIEDWELAWLCIDKYWNIKAKTGVR